MLIDQREAGEYWPRITPGMIEEAHKKEALGTADRAARLLRCLYGETKQLSDYVSLSEIRPQCLAWSESTDWGDIVELLKFLEGRGCVRGQMTFGQGGHYQVTTEGHILIEKAQAKLERERAGPEHPETESAQVFVAMWLDEEMNNAYADGIRPAIKKAGYRPFMIAEEEFIDKIDERIMSELERSKFVVADFTHGSEGARGSVYYEAGYAHGLGKPVVYTCHLRLVNRLHFDTRQYNHIVWQEPEDLFQGLYKRICDVIGEGPLQ